MHAGRGLLLARFLLRCLLLDLRVLLERLELGQRDDITIRGSVPDRLLTGGIVVVEPGGILVKQLPPLVIVGLLDGDAGRWVPNALPRRQVGEHVLLGAGLDDLDPLHRGGSRPRGWIFRGRRRRLGSHSVGKWDPVAAAASSQHLDSGSSRRRRKRRRQRKKRAKVTKKRSVETPSKPSRITRSTSIFFMTTSKSTQNTLLIFNLVGSTFLRKHTFLFLFS